MNKPTLEELQTRPTLWIYNLCGEASCIHITYPNGIVEFCDNSGHTFKSSYSLEEFLEPTINEFVGFLD